MGASGDRPEIAVPQVAIVDFLTFPRNGVVMNQNTNANYDLLARSDYLQENF